MSSENEARSRELERRALDLFEAVVDLDDEHRGALLDRECQDVFGLREAVEGLLAADRGATAAEVLPGLAPELDNRLVGQRLGPWHVDGPLGRGGMATVFAGHRADGAFERDVAIKVIRVGCDEPGFQRRFEEERHILARLDHSNIARVLDGGSTDDGRAYLVMELVGGEAIDVFCTTARLTIEQRLRLFLDVCAAVEHAHRNLVVHRDIKPANILVNHEGVVKLLDFGIAKVLEDDAAADVTSTGFRALTPSYASPEQVAGEAMTTASDVYSLGVLLYCLLVGRLPYDLPDTRPATLQRVVCDEPPGRPSTVVLRTATAEVAGPRQTTPRALARALTGDLDTILLRSLEKRPEDRYRSVEALREDVQRHLDGRPVRARPPSSLYLASRWIARHRWGAAVTLVLVLVIAGGVASTLRQARLVSLEAAKLELTNTFLRDMLAAPNPRAEGRDVSVAELLDRASERLARESSVDANLTATLRRTLAQTYLGLGLYDEAEREARAAVEASALLSDDSDRAASLARLGAVLTAERDFEAAEPILREALGILPAGDVTAAETHAALAVLLSRSGREKEAIPEFKTAISRYRELGIEDVRLATALNDLGVAHGRIGELEVAELLHREAYRRMLEDSGPHHPGTGEALANLAGAVDAAGRHDEAEPLYREAVEIGRETSGPDHPEVIALTTSRALNLRLLGRLDEACTIALEAVETGDRIFDQYHPLAAYSHYVLGEILLDLGRVAEAEPHLRLAVEARRRSLPEGHWLIASAEVGLGATLDHLGRDEEAEAMLVNAYETLERDRGPQHERTVAALQRLLDFYERRDRNEVAELRQRREKAP